jgi:alkylated DNA nucleotide flippase Atl1
VTPQPQPIMLTPSEVCERWRIDLRTLDKLDLPWVRVSDRVRRIALTVVLEVEQRERLLTS